MVQFLQTTRSLDVTFAALADPTRRAIIEELGRGDASIGHLARRFTISLTGAGKHVKVLQEAGFVQTRKVGRTRWCSLAGRPVADAWSWIDSYGRMIAELRPPGTP